MAELINKTDTLNEGREKLNEAIKDADSAKADAGVAVDTANQALAQSESTQTQLDTIVINGDSSVEAAQARVSSEGTAYGTLKQRLDTEHQQLSSQLADIDDDVSLLDRSRGVVSILEYEHLKNGNDWQPAIQAALDSGARKVTFPNGSFSTSTIEIPITLCELEGVGSNGTFLRHLGGGALIQKKSSINRIRDFSIRGLYLEGNGTSEETYGIDLTGFSYGSIINVRCRLFNLDGIYAKGNITPVNNQVSNITFINVTSNNNKRHGLMLQGSAGIENTALTFNGGEIAGNGVDGVHIDSAEKVVFLGSTMQGNGRYDVYDNGHINSYTECWIENPKAKTFFFDVGSRENVLNRPKTSYPIWNFFVDKGESNTLVPEKQKGLLNPKVLNDNIYLESPDGNGVPQGYAKQGAVAITTIQDNTVINKNATRFTVTANFQGYIIQLPQHPLFLQNKWVTLKIKYRANTVNGVTHRIYTRFNGAVNNTNGQFVSETFEKTDGKYVTRLFDIKFAENAGESSTADIIHYLAYSNGAENTNVIDIAEIEVLL